MPYPVKLTLKNLMPSETDKAALRLFSKQQRLALYNLCEIVRLTSYDKADRAAAEKFRELMRLNTLDPKVNKCEFDKTDKEKKLESLTPKKNADKKNANTWALHANAEIHHWEVYPG